jgi:apolipoprotein N-acyltransferase
MEKTKRALMLTKLETPAKKFQAAFASEAARTGSWIPLLVAILLMPFANGANAIAVAGWLAPLFLLRFTRAQRIIVGVPVVLAVQVIALAIQYRGMVPFPTPLYVAVMVFYGLCFTLPYLGDRLLSRRLSVFSGTLVFPLVWTAIEYLLSLGPFGSWFATAYSQYGNLALLQMLSITGLWGVTFLIGWTASAGNALWEEWTISRRVPRVATMCALLVIMTMLTGGARLALFPPAGKTVRVATLSGINSALHPDPKVVGRFFRHESLTPEEIATIRKNSAAIDDDLLNRSAREAKAGARIIFWGEANAPVLKEDENDLIRRGGILAKANGIYLGMVLASWHLETTPPLENKIVLIQPDGTPAWEFFKAHPVPGGEAAISIRGDGKLRALDTPYGRLSSVICFDADFPQLLGQAGRLGTDLLLDPSNDWKAIDPWHTRMASFRAIEQGFNLVRHTSQGLSAAFDYQGRQLAAMDHYATTNRVLVAQVPVRGTRTIYALLGDWFAWVCLVGLTRVVILGVKSRR